MLRWGSLICFLLAGGCAQEPDFDTRYEEAEEEISAKAEAIDAELAGEEKGMASSPAGERERPED
jgi:pyruvate/2-oxoacid:ferredoxin oxidoreductase alpha subunit